MKDNIKCNIIFEVEPNSRLLGSFNKLYEFISKCAKVPNDAFTIDINENFITLINVKHKGTLVHIAELVVRNMNSDLGNYNRVLKRKRLDGDKLVIEQGTIHYFELDVKALVYYIINDGTIHCNDKAFSNKFRSELYSLSDKIYKDLINEDNGGNN